VSECQVGFPYFFLGYSAATGHMENQRKCQFVISVKGSGIFRGATRGQCHRKDGFLDVVSMCVKSANSWYMSKAPKTYSASPNPDAYVFCFVTYPFHKIHRKKTECV
jgi:hypothetical protein